TALLGALAPRLPRRFPPADRSVPDRTWDAADVKGAIATASQVVRMGLDATSWQDRSSGNTRAALWSAALEFREVRRSLQRLRRDEETHWVRGRVLPLREALEAREADRPELLAAWAEESVAESPTERRRAELVAMAHRVAEILTNALEPLGDV